MRNAAVAIPGQAFGERRLEVTIGTIIQPAPASPYARPYTATGFAPFPLQPEMQAPGINPDITLQGRRDRRDHAHPGYPASAT